MDTKICSSCKRDLPTSDFYRDKRARDGLYSQCKECHKERNRENNARRRQEHPEEIRQELADWRERNPEARAAQRRRWYERHPEHAAKMREAMRAKRAAEKNAQAGDNGQGPTRDDAD